MQLLQPNEAVAQLEAAENDLQSAWQLFKGEHTYHDKLAQIHNALGHSYFVGGDLDQAHQLLNRSLAHVGHKPDPQREPEALSRWIQTRLYLATIQIRQGLDENHLLQDVEQAIAALIPHGQLREAVTQSHAQYHWLQAQALQRAGLTSEAAAQLQSAIQWQMEPSHATGEASWHFWLGRLFSQQGKIAQHLGDLALESSSLMSAREHWQAAYAQGDKRWSAHAGFELFEAWLHSPELSSEQLATLLTMAQSLVESHETLPTAWFWLSELAYHTGDMEQANSALEKLERLRRRETLEDRLLKALIISGSASKELLSAPCGPGTHAAWLQKTLEQSASFNRVGTAPRVEAIEPPTP